jgi:hypothetical protein
MQVVLNGPNAHPLAESKLSDGCPPSAVNLGGNFRDEFQPDLSPPDILPLILDGFPLFGNLLNLVNLGLFHGLVTAGFLNFLQLFLALASPWTKSQIRDMDVGDA